jgi:Cu/Ag efflux protein CusF
MKKAIALIVLSLMPIYVVSMADAQEKKETTAETTPAATPTTTRVAAPATPPAVGGAPAAAAARAPVTAPAARRPNFTIIFGSITKIDNSDPTKPRLEVKSDMDGASHVIDLTPWTNVTKVTDVSELKPGETVRIMARKVENNEVAMTVVFGKIRNIYAPRPAASAVAPPAAPAKAAPKK